MTKYIIFDFDGTLVDSKNVLFTIYNQIAEKHQYKKITHEEIEGLRKLSIKERCRFLQIPMYKIPFLARKFQSQYKDALTNITLLAGIKELLEELTKKGYQLAIISSNSENNIRAFLKENRIDNINQIFCSSNIFGKNKVIGKFLKANKLHHNEVIYVGDEIRDIEASKKCDVKVIWVEWGYDVIERAERALPDYIAKTPHDILTIVQSHS